MSPRRAEYTGTGRIALVGAETAAGARLRAALAASGFPGARLDLFGEQPDLLRVPPADDFREP